MNAGAPGSVRIGTAELSSAAIADAVRRARQGDVDAFEIVYRAHAARIYALCRRMTGDDLQARDLVQDVFVRAWERLTTFREQSAFSTWLHRLGVNVVLEHLRSRKREDSRHTDANEWLAVPGSPAARLDTRMDLDKALARLPAGARTVFLLHDIEGYSHDEIAQMTGIAPGTARAQLWRARRALMGMLDA
ncbi:MAG TPA: sigma-70 family RNA polymerase sigma factor [Gemmatimonadaceae bacterium]|jgi:RNA polymerase sigma-70 factor (ECF subfamily)|nr:sigma-70 family RNA polymerase sigma factor [Gemmatimonadaceae bacterium]